MLHSVKKMGEQRKTENKRRDERAVEFVRQFVVGFPEGILPNLQMENQEHHLWLK